MAWGARGYSRWRGGLTSTPLAWGWSLHAAIECIGRVEVKGEGNVLCYGKELGRGLEHSSSSCCLVLTLTHRYNAVRGHRTGSNSINTQQ